jgi:putative peptide zinc metalloprotease protein
MTGLTRRWVTLLGVVLACVLPLGSAQATPDTENVATAINQTDGTQVRAFAWDVDKRRGDDPVDHLNKAFAHASCADCGATAIAFQVVLVSGNPRQVVPVNEAIMINEECTNCVGVAHARQFVRVMEQPFRITGDGRATLSSVREELEAAQYLPIDQQYLAVEAQEERVRQVVNTELVVKGTAGKEPDVLAKRFYQATDLD